MEITFMHLGDLSSRWTISRKRSRSTIPTRHRDDSFLYALNPGVAMPCFAAWALWFLGQPDQALQSDGRSSGSRARVVRAARSGARAFFAASFISFAAITGWPKNMPRPLSPFLSEHGLVMYGAMATSCRLDAERTGTREEAIEQMREATRCDSMQRVRRSFVRTF